MWNYLLWTVFLPFAAIIAFLGKRGKENKVRSENGTRISPYYFGIWRTTFGWRFKGAIQASEVQKLFALNEETKYFKRNLNNFYH